MSENQISNAPPFASKASHKKPLILFSVAQWVVTGFFILLALVMLADLRKLGVPGAPLVLLWAALGVTIIVALLHAPPTFFRLSRIGKIGAYVVALVAIGVFGTYAGQMREAYSRTPEGAKEAALRAEEQRQLAIETAKAEARAKADEQASARAAAARQQADLEAQKPRVCKILVDQVVSQSKSGDGPEVLEINNVVPDTVADPENPISCSGDAITSRGNMPIQFGLIHTPQGKDLLTYRFQ